MTKSTVISVSDVPHGVGSGEGAMRLHRVIDPDRIPLTEIALSLSGSMMHGEGPKSVRSQGGRGYGQGRGGGAAGRGRGRAAPTHTFPGPSPCSMDRADIQTLLQRPYVVTEKTDGQRYLVACCTYKGVNVCFLMDRTMSISLLPLRHVPTAWFQGSLMDAELAFNKNMREPQLLIFDAWRISNVPVHTLSHTLRMQAVHAGLGHYVRDAADGVRLLPKIFWPLASLPTPEFAHHICGAGTCFDLDGYIFQPCDERVGCGRQRTLFKLKPSTHHTVDFICTSTCDGSLAVYDAKTRRNVVVARLDELPPEFALDRILECAPVDLTSSPPVWKCILARNDKDRANDSVTYEATLRNIHENVCIEEIVAAVDGAQAADELLSSM